MVMMASLSLSARSLWAASAGPRSMLDTVSPAATGSSSSKSCSVTSKAGPGQCESQCRLAANGSSRSKPRYVQIKRAHKHDSSESTPDYARPQSQRHLPGHAAAQLATHVTAAPETRMNVPLMMSFWSRLRMASPRLRQLVDTTVLTRGLRCFSHLLSARCAFIWSACAQQNTRI